MPSAYDVHLRCMMYLLRKYVGTCGRHYIDRAKRNKMRSIFLHIFRRKIFHPSKTDFTDAKRRFHSCEAGISLHKSVSDLCHRAKRKRCGASSFTFSEGKYFTRRRRISPTRSVDFTHSEGMNFTARFLFSDGKQKKDNP